jgi:hypothetical protein
MLVSVTPASPNISTMGDLSQFILLNRLSIPAIFIQIYYHIDGDIDWVTHCFTEQNLQDTLENSTRRSTRLLDNLHVLQVAAAQSFCHLTVLT